ncbi:MAG: hypothetical protein IMF09_05695 [Proteobacteria bacterium]|nr:hypothetical protein [Pseudomonadota bacterium]
MSLSRLGIAGIFTRFASKLRFPYLFILFAVLLGVDLLVPDPMPFADEMLLGLGVLLLSRLRKPAEDPTEEEKTN